ncbi:T9SS type A sorting domain-containing protein [bacterium]|nr:T9SS type A sorting domain-containing protein [bacterium]
MLRFALWIMLLASIPVLSFSRDARHLFHESTPLDVWEVAVETVTLGGGYYAVPTGRTGLQIIFETAENLEVVGRFQNGKQAEQFASFENVGYLGSVASLDILNLETPEHPSLIQSRQDWYGHPRLMEAAAEKLVIVCNPGEYRLVVYSVSDPRDPVLQCNTLLAELVDEPTDLVIIDDLVLIIERSLFVYSLSDQGSPELICEIPPPAVGVSPANLSLAVSDNLVWLVGAETGHGNTWLQAVDLSNPSDPIIYDPHQGLGGYDIAVRGELAAVIGGIYWETYPPVSRSPFPLELVDLSEPAHPLLLDSGYTSHELSRITFSENTLLTTALNEGLRSYETESDGGISERIRMQKVATFEGLATSPNLVFVPVYTRSWFYFPEVEVNAYDFYRVSIQDGQPATALPPIRNDQTVRTVFQSERALYVGTPGFLTAYKPETGGLFDELSSIEFSNSMAQRRTRFSSEYAAIGRMSQAGVNVYSIGDPEHMEYRGVYGAEAGRIRQIVLNQNNMILLGDEAWAAFDMRSGEDPEPVWLWGDAPNETYSECWATSSTLYCSYLRLDGTTVVDSYNATEIESITIGSPITFSLPQGWINISQRGSREFFASLYCSDTGDSLQVRLFDLSRSEGNEQVGSLTIPSKYVPIDLGWSGGRIVVVTMHEVLILKLGSEMSLHVESVYPITSKLNPAYPNPFNPSTVIPFELKQAGKVRVSVFDIRGRKVKTLVDGQRTAGQHRVEWDGRSASGLPVASGSYIVRLEVDGVQASRRITLVK